jgi:hypothetical protein
MPGGSQGGYPFREYSPANPPHWLSGGHILLAEPTAR